MKKATLAIERILEARFGKIQARSLVFGRTRLLRKEIQFTDIRHMSELCERYRARVRALILSYRLWEAAQELKTDALTRLYGAIEGATLHQRITDDLKLWYFAHRDYHAMRRIYLGQCTDIQAWEKAHALSFSNLRNKASSARR